MRRGCVLALSLLTLTLAFGRPAGAQTEARLTRAEMAMACAPPASRAVPPDRALHVIGAQDVVPRTLYGSRDLLVIDGGTSAGVQLGQRFFVRRSNQSASAYVHEAHTAVTAGWVTVVAVNESTAIANVDQVCGPILQMDYLEPYASPAAAMASMAVAREEAAGEPDFASLGRVVGGDEQRTMVGIGDFAVIDRGTDQGVTAGARFAVYRDLGVAGMPLTSIGEAIVVSAGDTQSVARITRARDAIFNGDYVAPRK